MSGHNKWSKIKHKKAATDSAKSREFGKLVRLIQVEAKKVGGDIQSPSLANAIAKAQKANMPKDNIERAIGYIPDHLKDDQWALGICSLSKNLEKILADLGLKKIDSKPGTKFNPELHEAVQFDEATEGEHEVIAEELQPGYLLGDKPLRHAMVRVTRQ